MKNYNLFKKGIEDKAEWVVQTVAKSDEILGKHYDCKSYPTNKIVSSIIDSNMRIFFTPIIFLKHLIFLEVKQKALVMQLLEHLHQDQ